MKINKYPDGSSYVTVENIGRDFKIFKLNSYENLWYLNQYVDAYNNAFKITPNILIPSLIDAQADRRFNSNESSGLKLVCEFLNNMNANFKIFHPHNSEVVEALIDNVQIIDNSDFISYILSDYLILEPEKFYPENNLILMSSDAGGFKPLMKLCDKIGWQGDTISAVKHRYWNHISKKSELTQLLTVKDLEGKDVLIIDDICVYGGTFKGLSKLLKSRNCGKLYLAVSHMTVQDLGEDPVTNYFDKVFTTNSKYNTYYADNLIPSISPNERIPQNLEIIKMF
jgi:ribose-phosphate pyrophosphokinase